MRYSITSTRRWLGVAAALVVVGLGAQTVRASIIYSGTINQTLAVDTLADSGYNGGVYDMVVGSATARLQSGGWTEFSSPNSTRDNPDYMFSAGIDPDGLGSTLVRWVDSGGTTRPDQLNAGVSINSGNTFTSSDTGIFGQVFNGTESGDWLGGVNNKYVGFRVSQDSGSTWNYGWAQISVASGTPQSLAYQLTIHDWAYETTAGAGILAGDTASAVPEPSTILLLGVGGALVYRWQKRNRK